MSKNKETHVNNVLFNFKNCQICDELNDAVGLSIGELLESGTPICTECLNELELESMCIIKDEF